MALEAKNRGNAAFTAGNFELAVTEFTNAIGLDPTNHVLYSNRSGAYAGMKKYQEALSDASKCIELNGSFVKGYSRKGLALFNLGKYDEAKVVYESGLKVDGNNEQLKDGLRETTSAMKSRENPMAKMFGPDMFAKLAANPKTAHMLNNPQTLAKIKMLQGNPNALQGALQDPEMMTVVSVLLGIDMMGAPPGADGGSNPNPARAPPTAGASASKPASGPVYMDSDSEEEEAKPKQTPQQAEKPAPKPSVPEKVLSEEEKKALETTKKADAVKNKGNDLYKKKQFDEAIALYDEAIALDPSNLNYVLNRSAANFEKKSYDLVIKDCNFVIEECAKAPSSTNSVITAKAYARLGATYNKTGELEASINAYKKSLVEDNNYDIRQKMKEVESMKKKRDESNYVDPEKSAAANELGKVSFKDGKFPEAIAHYSEAILRNPTDAKLYANRAACYVKLMTWSKAMEDCDHCIKLDPTYVKAYIRKGKIQHCIKEYHKAMSTFEEAAKLDPSNSDLIEARRATQIAISEANSSGEVDPDRQRRAMEDPEIQAIMRDPIMNKILQDLERDPRGSQAALKDPKVMANLQKLIAAGIIRTG